MGTLIDSSVLVAAERGSLDLERMAAQSGEEHLAIAAITASELLHGVHRAERRARRSRREAFVEALLSELPVIPFDLLCARVHARLWADLASRGIGVGAHDLIIAATAIARGFALATRDERSFDRITELDRVRW